MITIRENKITTEQIPSVCPTPTVKKLFGCMYSVAPDQGGLA